MGGCASIRLLALWLKSHDLRRRTERSVRFALKVVMQNDGDFMEVMLLH